MQEQLKKADLQGSMTDKVAGTVQSIPAKVLEDEFHRHFGLKACSNELELDEVAALIRLPSYLSYLVSRMTRRELANALARAPAKQQANSGLASRFGVFSETMATWIQDCDLVGDRHTSSPDLGSAPAETAVPDVHILFDYDDFARAQHLHEVLEAKGLAPWTAEISTHHGDRWVTNLNHELGRAKVVAVLLGAKLGGIQLREIELLETRPSGNSPRLIPIVLPERNGSQPLPGFLQSCQIAYWKREVDVNFEGIAKAVRKGPIRK